MLIPSAFAHTTITREGAAGRAWLDQLPGWVEAVLEQWDCVRDGASRHGGVALVVPVTGPYGPAVIKLSFPHEGNRGEPAALRLLDGRAAVRLYEHDPDRWAMLLERADGPTPAALTSIEESIEVMGELARRFAETAAPDLIRLSDTAPGWRQQLEQQTAVAGEAGLPGPLLDRAHRAIDLVADDRTATLVHGDLHEGNVLGGERERWLSIDPKGWAGTAAHDAFTVALTRHEELTDLGSVPREWRSRIRRFASTAGVDPDAAQEIAYARAVSSLLYERVTNADTFGARLLEALLGVE